MSLNDFFSIITKDKNIEPYIVALKYKYDFEDKYTIANEYLDVDMSMPNHPYYPFEWLNDWNEGQTDIEVLGFKRLSEIRIIEQESCSDAISRQAVNTLIDELARAISDERCCTSRGRSTATIMRDILHLQPVNPQPKTGHWIDNMDLGYHVSICSNCEWRGHGNEVLIYRPKYCPNCGAKMIEPQERSNKSC